MAVSSRQVKCPSLSACRPLSHAVLSAVRSSVIFEFKVCDLCYLLSMFLTLTTNYPAGAQTENTVSANESGDLATAFFFLFLA